jgi:hypothetical protein
MKSRVLVIGFISLLLLWFYIVFVRKPFLFADKRQKMEEEREDKQTGRLSIGLKSRFLLLLSLTDFSGRHYINKSSAKVILFFNISNKKEENQGKLKGCLGIS